MKPQGERDSILIRLEIEIPHGASQPQIINQIARCDTGQRTTEQHTKDQCSKRRLDKRATVNVECVLSGGYQAMVRASGQADVQSSGGTITVYLMIDENSSHPGGDPQGGGIVADPNTGKWTSGLLGPVDCGKRYYLHGWIVYQFEDDITFSQPFTPNCDGAAPCDDAQLPSLTKSKTYRATFSSQAKLGAMLQGNILLLPGASAAGEAVWASCPQREPFSEWKLWVTTRGGHPYGTLALRRLFGTTFDAPLLWRSGHWQADDRNLLVFESPSEMLGHVPAEVVISPA